MDAFYDVEHDCLIYQNSVENVSGELNSIINCLEATKFVQLDDPDRKFWQMFSLKENPAEDLGSKQESAMKLVALTQRGLARVYPAGTRVDSSNYNPIPFWMRWAELSEGCQNANCPISGASRWPRSIYRQGMIL